MINLPTVEHEQFRCWNSTGKQKHFLKQAERTIKTRNEVIRVEWIGLPEDNPPSTLLATDYLAINKVGSLINRKDEEQ